MGLFIPFFTLPLLHPLITVRTGRKSQNLHMCCINLPDSNNAIKYLLATPHRHTETLQTNLPPGERAIACSFGVVADVQYANLPVLRGVKEIIQQERSFFVRRRRAWNEALQKLEAAVRAFNKAQVDFMVNLGDIVEGYGEGRRVDNRRDLALVLDSFAKVCAPVRHVIGNHCRCIPLSELLCTLHLTEPYYSFSPVAGWRFLVLHSAELCGSAVDISDVERQQLQVTIEENGRMPHHYHGAVGGPQLIWLENELQAAFQAEQRVIVLSHYPLADGAARHSHVVANTMAVRKVLEHEQSPVVLCLAGHDHMGMCFIVHTCNIDFLTN